MAWTHRLPKEPVPPVIRIDLLLNTYAERTFRKNGGHSLWPTRHVSPDPAFQPRAAVPPARVSETHTHRAFFSGIGPSQLLFPPCLWVSGNRGTPACWNCYENCWL